MWGLRVVSATPPSQRPICIGISDRRVVVVSDLLRLEMFGHRENLTKVIDVALTVFCAI